MATGAAAAGGVIMIPFGSTHRTNEGSGVITVIPRNLKDFPNATVKTRCLNHNSATNYGSTQMVEYATPQACADAHPGGETWTHLVSLYSTDTFGSTAEVLGYITNNS